MKTLTIIPVENKVYIDGIPMTVDCSSIDSTIHAIQFNVERGKGHIEFVDDDPNDGQRKTNETITTIDPYQELVSAWMKQKEVQETIVAVEKKPSGPIGANVIA